MYIFVEPTLPPRGGVDIGSTRGIFGQDAGVGKPASVLVVIDWIVYVFGPWICSHSTGLLQKEYRGFREAASRVG